MAFEKKWLAKNKSETSPFSEKQWLQAIESAQNSLKISDLNLTILEQLILASQSPGKLTIICRLIYLTSKTNPQSNVIEDLIQKYVNPSPFGLSDWVEAIHFFYNWLQLRKRNVNFISMLDYLDCCVASPDAKEPGQTLLALIEDMLHYFDYHGS